jgi:hypothetical protein
LFGITIKNPEKTLVFSLLSSKRKKKKKKKKCYAAFELFVALAHQRRLLRRVEKVKHNAALHHLAVKDVGVLRQLDICNPQRASTADTHTHPSATTRTAAEQRKRTDAFSNAPANDGNWSQRARDELPEKRDDDDEY